ncbi:BUD3 [Candida margitis]|uniref:BUD3 n=1 Tax=Candida margitis TaxID=1775924 RepID=UPI0022277C6F|nr:BUD3 [Candida margitis]KAI5970711.1 BUD3 [Candida margitis]
MSLYTRYVSGEHDKEHFKSKQTQTSTIGNKTPNSIDSIVARDGIRLPFFNGDNHDNDTNECPDQNNGSLLHWLDILQRAAIFTGHDDVMFNQVITIVYKSARKNKLSTQTITKFGLASFPDLRLDSNSRFWPSCENLLPQYQKSHVRQALAISNLKNSNRMLNNHHHSINLPMWDETNAGGLASAMSLIQSKSPDEVGKKILELGLVQHQQLCSFTIDVIYDNDHAKEEVVEENNTLVSLLGQQLDQIFDSLLEYAPEEIKAAYTPSPDRKLVHFSNPKIQSILDELINVQTNYTARLVNLLQTFIIPLRISVTKNDNEKSSGAIQKINQIFPPTIDEITRVNCLLNDALLKARKVDDIEVIVAMGKVLPYFYKPFIRHEANVKHFNENLTKFSQNYKSGVFENLKINSSQYTVREIDSIVTGALLELPKFKLLLQRLHDAIEFEEIQLRNFDNDNDSDTTSNTLHLIDSHFTSAMDVIYAFSGADEHKVEARRRVFTPTGRMLTELAGNWPSELQFDWNSRKVVGIFQLHNVAPTNMTSLEILVVFSDYLLFFTVDDDDVDDMSKEHRKQLSVADALMHSLINEKPMPDLDAFPSMQVSAWSRIEDVLVSKYMALDEMNTEIECLRFLSMHADGFKSSKNGPKSFIRNYRVTGSRIPAEDIIVAVEKSKILHKSSSFHLFKSTNSNMHICYTAQSTSDYQTETFKSPFALILNMDVDVPCYFDDHPQLLLLLQATMVNYNEVKVTGYDKCTQQQINDIVESDQFSNYVELMVEQTFHNLFSSYNVVTHNEIEGNSSHLRYLVDCFLHDAEAPEKRDSTNAKSTHVGTSKSEPEVNLAKTPSNNPLSSTSSILSKLHLKRAKKTNFPIHEPKKPKKKVSNTFIPQGTKLEYKEIYKPVPTLQKRNVSPKSTVVESKPDLSTADKKNKRCESISSIDVSPNFKFPQMDKLDEIEIDHSVSIVDHEASTIKRLSTMDDISMVLKMSSASSFMGDYFSDDYDQTPNWECINAKNVDSCNRLNREVRRLSSQLGYSGDLIEFNEKSMNNSPGAVSNKLHELEPPMPLFVKQPANSRKSSNESSIFSHVSETPKSSNTLATPPLKSSMNGAFTGPNDFSSEHLGSNSVPRRIPRESSVRSISAHEYAIEFSKLIDEEFSKPPMETAIGTESLPTIKTTNNSPSMTLTPFHTNSSVVTLVSNSSNNFEPSDEDFHSSTEDQDNKTQVQPVVNIPESKDALPQKLVAKNRVTIAKTMRSSETKTKPLNEFMRDDSIVQLTNLLRNSIKFSDFNVEMIR